jgi:sulfur carrier protein ThiS
MSKDTIVVESLQHGDTRLELSGTEGMTLPEICKALDIRFEGSSFFINGTRVSQSEAESVEVKGGDKVRVAPKGDGGR